MSSVSLKDLCKTITTAFTSGRLNLPLPVELRQAAEAYTAENSPQKEQEANRLQEDLIDIYEKCILDRPERLAPFLRILRILRPVLQGKHRSLQWWDKLSIPIMENLVAEKGLAHEAKHTMLEVLVYDAETAKDPVQSAQTTASVADSLMAIWLEKTIMAEQGLDEHAMSVVKQVQMILTEFGKKKPKHFLELINKIFVKKSTRIPALGLLCDFFRLQPPHLHELMQTPLFENLLQCLQIDTSTRVISLGITALIMFLPHIPMSAANHLPALFNIYSRLLFWDRERNAADILPRGKPEVESEDTDEGSLKQSSETSKSWDKLAYLLESDDDAVPELLHYFTFLYGLYPLNFMDYVRKPQRYLRHANFPGSDDLDIEPAEIRQRSEPYRQVHLLHPNFFTLTIESELSDKTRWKETDAADVVADCMSLYMPSEDLHLKSRSRREREIIQSNPDIPFHSRFGSDPPSPEIYRTSKHRNISETRRSKSQTANSPSTLPQSEDNYQLIPIPGTAADHPLSDLLGSPSGRSSIHQPQRKDTADSFTLSDTHEDSNVNAYLEKQAFQNAPRSPSLRSLRPTLHNEVDLKVKYLQRKVTLMQNDLNFERYLSQQYQSHIGRLRSEQIQNTRAESETQNLINTNRALRSKVEELKMTNTRNKVESEKSKEHSRKWDGQVTGRLKALREDQKQWTKEKIELKDENDHLKQNVKILTQIVVQSESRELRARQRMETAGNLNLIEELSNEVERLKLEATRNSAREFAAAKAIKNEQAALSKVKFLEMQVESRDDELAKTKKAYQAELKSNRLQINRGLDEKKREKFQEVLDEGMAAARRKTLELEQLNKMLYDRVKTVTLERNDMEIHASNLQDKINRLAKLQPTPSNEVAATGTPLPSAPALGAAAIEFKTRQRALSDSSSSVVSSESSESIDSNSSDCPILRRSSGKLREMYNRERALAQSKESPLRQFEAPQPFNPEHATPPGTARTATTSKSSNDPAEERRGSSSGESQSSSHGGHAKVKTPKIAPESKLRQFGRGGTQNVGLKDKAALKADEERNAKHKDDTPNPEPKKAKRNLGIRGLRGFV